MSTHLKGNTTEMWAKLDAKFYIVHHFSHIGSSYQEKCFVTGHLCHNIVWIFCRDLLSLRFTYVLFAIVWDCFAFLVNVYMVLQIICSL